MKEIGVAIYFLIVMFIGIGAAEEYDSKLPFEVIIFLTVAALILPPMIFFKIII